MAWVSTVTAASKTQSDNVASSIVATQTRHGASGSQLTA